MSKAADKTSLEIKRFVNAPRAQVYGAWTDPAQLKQWFGPEWVQTRDIVAEVRTGGKFRWDLINCDGEEKTIEARIARCSRKKRSCLLGDTAMTSFGRIKRVSSLWSFPIAMVERSYD